MLSKRGLLLILLLALSICAGFSLADPNANDVVSPDLFPNLQASTCPGDFDGNGMVNIADFLLFADVLGTSSDDTNYNALMDMDGNGEIGIADFLSFVDVFGTTCETPPPSTSDRAVLVALYNATDGPNWRNNTNWLTDAPLDDWYGVDTDDLKNLTELSLGYNNLQGPIPPEIGNLKNLEVLKLFSNELSGNIPPELGNLTNLRRLYLHRNALSGPIPPKLDKLVKLQVLRLWDNNLSGPIPPELGNLTSLRTLDLSNNALSGPIPPELGGLANLIHLTLSGGRGVQRLSGLIPPELGNLTNLLDLDLNNNALSGPIPPELGNLTNLRRLELRWNALSGPIPSELGALQTLERLFVDGNNLSGSLPASFVEFPLRLFDFDNNDGLCAPGTTDFIEWLEGIATRAEGPLCNESDRAVLESLYESAGGSGWIDAEGWLSDDFLGAWHGIRVNSLGRVTAIDLNRNGLTGHLTSNLGELVRLTELSIGGNSALSDRLPNSLADLPPFQVLRYDGTGLCAPAEPNFQSWLGMTAAHEGTGVKCAPISERDVLVALFDAVGGPHWKRRDNWGSNRPLREWYGVTTDGDDRVTGLDLSGNNLMGLVPAGLRDLVHLTSLDLSSNNLTGAVPRALGRLTQLEVLRLNFNDLSGSVPPKLGNLTNLENLDLSSTHLTGSIPPELGNLTSLRTLDLGDNALSGSIPPELGNLTNLLDLDLNNNALSGSIPPELGNLTSLKALELRWNALSGLIPPELGNLTNLENLDLSSTHLTGSIPPELSNLASLKRLYLSRAGLTGSIPPELGNLANLGNLNLSSNDLTGLIPPELGNLTRLVILEVGGNRLSGPVVPEFGDLSRLIRLILANNELAGVLPTSLTKLGSLDTFQAGGTGLCAPSGGEFSKWLEGISDRRIALCEDASRMAYLVQAIQSRKFPIPLVADKAALLRVFVTAARANGDRIPRVRASFYLDGALVHVADIPDKPGPVPTSVDEGSLEKSANAVIPAEVVQPGLEMVVEIDLDGTLDAGLGVARRIPESGRAAVDVRALPVFDLTVIPLQSATRPDPAIVATVAAMAADPEGHELLGVMHKLLPVGGLKVVAHEPVLVEFTPGTYNTAEWLSIAKAIRVMEGGTGHYMTLFARPGARVGRGTIGGRTSTSSTNSETIAHELGHNMGLTHAPCGFPAGVDAAYPYRDGMIGAWGYDFSSARLIGPMNVDIMTYCNPAWISDYHFEKALLFRLADEGAKAPDAATSASSLLLWGGKDAEENPYLEPAFVVNAPPALPQSGSQYRITGRNATQTELFFLTFDMPEVACDDGSSSFAFVLPVDPEWRDKLASITLTGPGGSATLDSDTDRPMVILHNSQSGQVRGFLRDVPGEAMAASKIAVDALSPEPGLEVLYSRGIPGREAYDQ